jgi:predicted CXXCH cytochrome family protein
MNMKQLIVLNIILLHTLLGQSFAGIIPDFEKYSKEQVHGAEQDCTICHLSHKMKETGLLREPVSGLCIICHPDSKAPSEHVVDVVPSMDVGGLLLIEGKMTCVTCHDSHKNIFKNMLRISPQNLCQHCHKLIFLCHIRLFISEKNIF